MIPVILESPYAGNVELHLAYLRACMRDCLMRGEAPFASHGLYAQPGVLDDTQPAERALGIDAGFVWRPFAARTVVYIDFGISSGMRAGIADAEWHRQLIEYRQLSPATVEQVRMEVQRAREARGDELDAEALR